MKSIKLLTAGISVSSVIATILWAAIAFAAACTAGEAVNGCKTMTNPDGSKYCQCLGDLGVDEAPTVNQ